MAIKDWMTGAAIAAGATGTPEFADAQPPVPMTRPADAPKAPAPAAVLPKVDISDFAMTTATPPDLKDGKMQFIVKTLPKEKKVELVLDAKQVFGMASVVDKKGNLIALMTGDKEGKVRVLEVPEGTEVQLTVVMGKEKNALFSTGTDLINLTGGKPYNWMEGLAKKIEENKGWNVAANTYARPLFDGNLLDNYRNAVKDKTLPVDPDAPKEFKSRLAEEGAVPTWDGAGEQRIRDAIKGDIKK